MCFRTSSDAQGPHVGRQTVTVVHGTGNTWLAAWHDKRYVGGFRRMPQQCKLVVTAKPAFLLHGTSTDAGMQYCTNRSADAGNSCTVLARADVWTDSSGASGPVTPHCTVPRVTGKAHHQHQKAAACPQCGNSNTVRTTGDL